MFITFVIVVKGVFLCAEEWHIYDKNKPNTNLD